ncbi:MAG: hypothetical protein ACJ8C4_10040 [Gemmataceae bacterium]
MFRFAFAVTFVACLGTSSANLPSWEMSYRQAKDIAAQAQKPLVVVIGTGSAGWGDVVSMEDQAASAVRANFVCCYIDRNTERGAQLAREFEMVETTGVVMSDRTGELQAFRRTGKMESAELHRAALRYSDPAYVVRTTETQVPVQQANYYSNYAPPTQGGCPNCQQGNCPSCANGNCPMSRPQYNGYQQR